MSPRLCKRDRCDRARTSPATAQYHTYWSWTPAGSHTSSSGDPSYLLDARLSVPSLTFSCKRTCFLRCRPVCRSQHPSHWGFCDLQRFLSHPGACPTRLLPYITKRSARRPTTRSLFSWFWFPAKWLSGHAKLVSPVCRLSEVAVAISIIANSTLTDTLSNWWVRLEVAGNGINNTTKLSGAAYRESWYA